MVSCAQKHQLWLRNCKVRRQKGNRAPEEEDQQGQAMSGLQTNRPGVLNRLDQPDPGQGPQPAGLRRGPQHGGRDRHRDAGEGA